MRALPRRPHRSRPLTARGGAPRLTYLLLLPYRRPPLPVTRKGRAPGGRAAANENLARPFVPPPCGRFYQSKPLASAASNPRSGPTHALEGGVCGRASALPPSAGSVMWPRAGRHGKRGTAGGGRQLRGSGPSACRGTRPAAPGLARGCRAALPGAATELLHLTSGPVPSEAEAFAPGIGAGPAPPYSFAGQPYCRPGTSAAPWSFSRP